MSHVGIKCLSARDGEKRTADDDQGQGSCVPQVSDGWYGTECGKNGWRLRNPDNPENADDDEPEEHHGSEETADPRSAFVLDEKKDHQDNDRERNDESPHLWRVELDSLDRT